LKAAAAYAANKICITCTDAISRKTAHTVLGGLSGYAMEPNRKGITSGAIGALTAETVGDILISDSQEICKAARARVLKSKKPITMQEAINAEVRAKTDLAKIAAGAVAVLAHQNPSIALATASNAIDNEVAIRGTLYALAEFQAMVTATSQAMATMNEHGIEFEIDTQPSPKARAGKQEEPKVVERSQKSKRAKAIRARNKQTQPSPTAMAGKQTNTNDDAHDLSADVSVEALAKSEALAKEDDKAHDLTLHTIHKQSHVDAYGDVILEHAQEKHSSELAQRELWGVIKDDRIRQLGSDVQEMIKNPSWSLGKKILRNNFMPMVNDTVDVLAHLNFIAFAGATGRDLYQKKTTLGEVAFNTALTYGALKSIQYTGKGIKFVYQQGKDTIKDVIIKQRVLGNVAKNKAAREASNFPILEAKIKDITNKGPLKQYILSNIAESKAAREASNFPAPFVENPPLYPNRSTGHTWLESGPIETLSLNEIRVIKDEVLMYVINKDRKLIITSPLRNTYDHSHLGKGNPVYAAGDIYINNGKITRVDNRSGSYQPSGPQLGNLIEKSLYKNGFTEVRGKYIDWLKETNKVFVLRNIAESKAAREASKLPVLFVENPHASIWDTAHVSGSLALHDCLTYKASLSKWKKSSKAPFDVMGHGDYRSIDLEIKNIPRHGLSQSNLQKLQEHGKVELDAAQLLRLMRVSGYQKGQPINLSACQTGSTPNGFAQKVADRANVLVSAPTENIYFSIFKVISLKDRTLVMPNPNFGLISESGKPGIIKTFYPQQVNKIKMLDQNGKESVKNMITGARNQDNAVKSRHLIESSKINMTTDSAKILVAHKSKIPSHTQKGTHEKIIIQTGPHGRYEDVSYHKQHTSGQKSAAPQDGQKALDNSVRYSENSSNRVATEDGHIVVLRETGKDSGIFHGTIQTWEQTPQPMKNALIKNGFVDHKGRILT